MLQLRLDSLLVFVCVGFGCAHLLLSLCLTFALVLCYYIICLLLCVVGFNCGLLSCGRLLVCSGWLFAGICGFVVCVSICCFCYFGLFIVIVLV